jgi:hypothetical protein
MGDLLRRIVASFAGNLLLLLVSGTGLGTLLYLSWEHVTTAPWPLQAAFAIACLVIVSAIVGLGLIWATTQPKGDPLPRYVVWYRFPLRKVSWRLGSLSMTILQGNPAVIHGFGCGFKVNRGKIVPKRLFLEFFGGQQVDLRIQCGSSHELAESIGHIPAGAWNHCEARIVRNPHMPDDGVTNHPSIDQFLAMYGGFDLVFEYDKSVFRRRFSENEVKQGIDFSLSRLISTPKPAAVLKRTLRAERSS